jgi:perosamine synthetase
MNYNEKFKIKNTKNKLLLFFQKKSKRLHDPLFFGNEKKYLNECIDSGYVSYVGKFVNKFEKKISYYTKSKYSVATCSGTSALHLALCYYKVNDKDEILLPSFTYIATAAAIKYCNASLNFVDIENESLGVCPKKLLNYLSRISKKKGDYYFNKFTNKHNYLF